MSTTTELTSSELEFLNKCEEELKDRYTEKDEEFMKVFNTEPSGPPILDSWVQNKNTRNRGQRSHPYRRNKHGYNSHSNRDDFELGRNGRSYNRRNNYNRRDDHHSGYNRRDHYESRDKRDNYGSPSNSSYDSGNNRRDN